MLVTKEKIDGWTNPNYLDRTVIDSFLIDSREYILDKIYPVFREKIDYFINNRIDHTTRMVGFNTSIFIQYSTTYDSNDTFKFTSSIYPLFIAKNNLSEEQSVKYKIEFFDNLFKFLFMKLGEEYKSVGIDFNFIKRCDCEDLNYGHCHYMVFRIAIKQKEEEKYEDN